MSVPFLSTVLKTRHTVARALQKKKRVIYNDVASDMKYEGV